MNVFGNSTLPQAVSTALFQNDETGASIKIDVQIVDCIEETGLYEEPSQVDLMRDRISSKNAQEISVCPTSERR